MATTTGRHDTHATTAQGGGWSTKRIAVTALFCAVAAICTLLLEFPILPGVTWLKYDPSGIVALVAGFAFGPSTAAVVSVIPYGVIMAILATLSLSVPAALVYRRDTTMRGAVLGMAVGAVVCLVACILGNIAITPLYAGMSADAVVALVVPALLPFNLLKIAINCVVAALVYKPVSKALVS